MLIFQSVLSTVDEIIFISFIDVEADFFALWWVCIGIGIAFDFSRWLQALGRATLAVLVATFPQHTRQLSWLLFLLQHLDILILAMLDSGVCLWVRLHSPNHIRSIQITICRDINNKAALGPTTISSRRICLFHHRVGLLAVITLNDQAVLKDDAGLCGQALPVGPWRVVLTCQVIDIFLYVLLKDENLCLMRFWVGAGCGGTLIDLLSPRSLPRGFAFDWLFFLIHVCS